MENNDTVSDTGGISRHQAAPPPTPQQGSYNSRSPAKGALLTFVLILPTRLHQRRRRSLMIDVINCLCANWISLRNNQLQNGDAAVITAGCTVVPTSKFNIFAPKSFMFKLIILLYGLLHILHAYNRSDWSVNQECNCKIQLIKSNQCLNKSGFICYLIKFWKLSCEGE